MIEFYLKNKVSLREGLKFLNSLLKKNSGSSKILLASSPGSENLKVTGSNQSPFLLIK